MNIIHNDTTGTKENEAVCSDISFTVVTKAGKHSVLTKIITLRTDGGTEKDASKCRMWKGTAERITVPISNFESLLRRLKPNQALVHGVCGYEKVNLIKKERVKTKPKDQPKTDGSGVPFISRSGDFFTYLSGPGVGLLDHDSPRPESVALDPKALESYTPARLAEIISDIFPEFGGAATVSTFSASSCIYNKKTGRELRGKGSGFHLYYFPRNAADIPRFLKIFGRRLFLAGYGRIEISRVGSLLERTPVDLLVGSPERLDFAAGAVCGPGLDQRLPEPEYHPGALLDTEALKDLTSEEKKKYHGIIRQLKEKGAPDQERIKGAYLDQEAEKLSNGSGGKISMKQARETVKARQDRILVDDDLLLFAHEKDPVSVAYALDNGPGFDNKSCADPLEPEYDGGSQSKARFYWNEGRNPLIYSQAHGGIKYRFERFSRREPEVWSFEDVESILELHPAMLKWHLCLDPDKALTRARKVAVADDILSNNNFSDLETDMVRNMIKIRLGISKGAQDKVLKTAVKTKDTPFEDATHAEIVDDYINFAFKDREKYVATEGGIWLYNENKGIFEQMPLSKVGAEVGRRYTGSYCKRTSDYKSIANLAYDILEQHDFFKGAPYGIPARSGFIQLSDDGEIHMKPYSPEHRQLFRLPVDPAESGTESPLFFQYLEDSFKGSRMEEQLLLLQEVMGGMLAGCFSRLQKALLLYGTGENGKSVLLDILTSMFPPELHSSVSPELFDKEYYLSMLADKMINIVGELDKNKKLTAKFKDTVGCDTPVTARLPYKKPFEFTPKAAHVFSSNYYPQTTDHTHGFYRRWVIIEFKNAVCAEKKIPELGKKISTKELPQILAWALEGAKRLIKNNFILSLTETHEKNMTKWKNSKDSVYAFLHDEDEVERDKYSLTSKKEVFNTYKSWCGEMGYKFVGYQEFLTRCGKSFQPAKIPGGKRCFKELRLVRHRDIY